MKVRLQDREVLKAVDPVALRAYAVAQGWKFAEEYSLNGRSFGDIYLSEADENLEILLPNSSRFPDYAASVAQAISAMSEIELRDELQILKDIQVSGTDVLRVRAIGADESGSIDVEAGVSLFRSSHDLLLAAACAVGQKKRVYKAGKNSDATEYMKNVKFGQTEVGSFIVTLLSPVPPLMSGGQQEGLWPEFDQEPFERQVTRILGNAMEQVQKAVARVNSGYGIEEFEEAVELGVSANLCAATSKLIESGDGLDLSLTWAQSRKAPLPRSSFKFGLEDGRILNEAARLLKDKAPRPDEDLTGFVTKLSRSESRVPGTITIKAIVDDRMTSITTELPEDMYAEATVAHADRNTISISGDLVREGQRWKLNNPRDLTVLRDSSDD